jgi:hypothetical protein
MSESDWRDDTTVRRVVIGIGAVGIAVLFLLIALSIDREQAHRSEAQHSERGADQTQQSPSAIANRVCANAQQESGEETKQRDLCAQFQAAAAASRAADWTEAQAYIGIGGLTAVLVALYFNIIATNAATAQSKTCSS